MGRIREANVHNNNRSKLYPVAASQTIKKGDAVALNASGEVTLAAVGATAILGFAQHDITTDAAREVALPRSDVKVVADGSTAPHRGLIVIVATARQQLRGELKAASGAATAALVGTTAGFIVESGYFKLDTAALTKQAKITKTRVGENGLNEVEFQIIAANRVED